MASSLRMSLPYTHTHTHTYREVRAHEHKGDCRWAEEVRKQDQRTAKGQTKEGSMGCGKNSVLNKVGNHWKLHHFSVYEDNSGEIRREEARCPASGGSPESKWERPASDHFLSRGRACRTSQHTAELHFHMLLSTPCSLCRDI